MVTIEWTPEKKEAVIKMLDEWIRLHGATSGEHIMQSDGCIISSPELLSDLVDEIIKPKYSDEDLK